MGERGKGGRSPWFSKPEFDSTSSVAEHLKINSVSPLYPMGERGPISMVFKTGVRLYFLGR
jgi:hypothetical protein